mmetsp:Transcript_72697/g.168445  ORF Transcript_72697/g.168445 Transcript_72697/m.168445 type:complete len:207 (+) Transcript_72697:184-804(+)
MFPLRIMRVEVLPVLECGDGFIKAPHALQRHPSSEVGLGVVRLELDSACCVVVGQAELGDFQVCRSPVGKERGVLWRPAQSTSVALDGPAPIAFPEGVVGLLLPLLGLEILLIQQQIRLPTATRQGQLFVLEQDRIPLTFIPNFFEERDVQCTNLLHGNLRHGNLLLHGSLLPVVLPPRNRQLCRRALDERLVRLHFSTEAALKDR